MTKPKQLRAAFIKAAKKAKVSASPEQLHIAADVFVGRMLAEEEREARRKRRWRTRSKQSGEARPHEVTPSEHAAGQKQDRTPDGISWKLVDMGTLDPRHDPNEAPISVVVRNDRRFRR